MYEDNQNQNMPMRPEPDELRARFTAWLDTVLFRAKLKYLENHKQKIETVSLEEIPPDSLESQDNPFAQVGCSRTDFDFEEEKLARAFSELPLMRREVLRLLFVEEKTPDEISKKLQCSVNYVHLQKSRALKKLRSALTEGGDEFDQG